MSGGWYPRGSPGDPFPGWLVVIVIVFFLVMTIICGIDALEG